MATHWINNYGANMDNMYCVGLSLGGQTCGFMGVATNGTLGRITGILSLLFPWPKRFQFPFKQHTLIRLLNYKVKMTLSSTLDGVHYNFFSRWLSSWYNINLKWLKCFPAQLKALTRCIINDSTRVTQGSGVPHLYNKLVIHVIYLT